MTAISPELVERMVKLVREMAGLKATCNWIDTAEKIAALLPAPVDPDLIEARGIAERHFRGGGYSEGRWDGTAAVTLALEGVRRGRELANDGWIVWRGGECPVPAGTTVRWILRSGSEDTVVGADGYIWRHDESIDPMRQIIAYRIVKRAEGGK